MVSKSKSISELEKEIKDIEKKKKEEEKRKELEEKLQKLKTPSKSKISPRERVRRGFGKGMSGSLDRASKSFWG